MKVLRGCVSGHGITAAAATAATPAEAAAAKAEEEAPAAKAEEAASIATSATPTSSPELPDYVRPKPVAATHTLRHGTFRVTESNKLVNFVLVPEGLKPGRYVLGWRWDCEWVLPSLPRLTQST